MTGRKKKSDAFKIYPKNSVVEEPIMNEEKKIKKTRKKKETVEKIDTVELIQNGKITEFIPSKYQNDIWDFVKHGVGNAVVEANAGCAKTSTIVNAIRLIPESLKILFVAFNRDIVKELESKIRAFESENVDIKTLHSLGYSLLRRNFKEINFQLDEYKYRTFVKHNIKELTPIDLTEFSKSDYNSYIDNITTLTDLARYNLAQSEKELSVISDRHGIILLKDEMTVVLKILEWGKENIDTIDYTDMVWLPYELNLKPLGLTYDWIFIDECQDLNVAQRELFLRCFKKGTRFVAVGDKNQAIYAFSGADKESFDKLKSLPNTISLPLSISYRCPKRVIKLAQTFVPSIQARDDAPEGSIEYNKSIQDVQSGDMVLCRNKMPLVTVYMRYLRMGKKAFIRGKDIGLNLIKMLDKTEQSILNQDMKSDGVFVRLYDSLFEARNQLMLKRGLDLEDATLSETILTMYDNIKALETMSEGLSNVTQLKMRINNVFAENSDGICLSTVHKAKGLEADNVYILCKSLMPSRNAKQDWELEQELNLQYVAYTRAKNMLAFISEKEISPMAGLIDTSVVKTELSYIETVVNKILGKKTDSMMDEETFLKMKIKDATVIEEPKVNVKTLDSPSNNSDDDEEDYQEIINLLKKKGGLKKLKEFLVK